MPRVQNRTVLIVDNDSAYRSFLRESLQEVGYATRETANQEEALKEIATKRPSIVLVDVRLADDNDPHDHSGLKLFRQFPPNLPVIILTAHEDARVVRNALAHMPGLPLPKDVLFKGEGIKAVQSSIEKILEANRPSSLPWYRERSFQMLAALGLILLIGGILYLTRGNDASQITYVLILGVLVELIAGMLLSVFKVGH